MLKHKQIIKWTTHIICKLYWALAKATMYNSQTTDTVLQSSQLLRSWLLGNQMKDKAATSVIIAGKPEEAQRYHIGHGCWQPEDTQSYHIGHGFWATIWSTKLPHWPWLLGKQKKHKATLVLLYNKPAQQPWFFEVPDWIECSWHLCSAHSLATIMASATKICPSHHLHLYPFPLCSM
jgi:hypothetical protein